MALQMEYISGDGTVYPQCYVKVTAIVLSLSGGTICANFYADRSVWDGGGLPLVQPAYNADIAIWDSAGQPFDIAYDYLLTLPEFSGAVMVP